MSIVEQDVRRLGEALDDFASMHDGRYPGTLAELLADGSYFGRSSVPRDPWGREFCYDPPSDGYGWRVVSYGADGTPGGTGDDADVDSSELAPLLVHASGGGALDGR